MGCFLASTIRDMPFKTQLIWLIYIQGFSESDLLKKSHREGRIRGSQNCWKAFCERCIISEIHINGLVQDWSTSFANTLEILQSCSNTYTQKSNKLLGFASQYVGRLRDMEILSALLALCERNLPVTNEFPSQGAGKTGLFLLLIRTSCWTNTRDLVSWDAMTFTWRQCNGPLARYAKSRIAHAPRMPGTFTPAPISKETAS